MDRPFVLFSLLCFRPTANSGHMCTVKLHLIVVARPPDARCINLGGSFAYINFFFSLTFQKRAFLLENICLHKFECYSHAVNILSESLTEICRKDARDRSHRERVHCTLCKCIRKKHFFEEQGKHSERWSQVAHVGGRTTCDAARTPATEKAPNLCSRTEINFPLLVEPIEHRLMRPFIFLRTFVSSNQAKPSAFSSQLWSSQLVSPDGGHSKLELHFICKLSCDRLAKNSARTWKHFKRFQVGTCRVIQWIVFTVNTIHPANSVY